MLSNSLIGSIKFDEVPITIGGKAVALTTGIAWVDGSGSVLEIDFDTFDCLEPSGYGEHRATVAYEYANRPQSHGTLDERNVLEIARTIEADYRDQIKDLISSQCSRRERDPGPSQGARL